MDKSAKSPGGRESREGTAVAAFAGHGPRALYDTVRAGLACVDEVLETERSSVPASGNRRLSFVSV